MTLARRRPRCRSLFASISFVSACLRQSVPGAWHGACPQTPQVLAVRAAPRPARRAPFACESRPSPWPLPRAATRPARPDSPDLVGAGGGARRRTGRGRGAAAGTGPRARARRRRRRRPWRRGGRRGEGRSSWAARPWTGCRRCKGRGAMEGKRGGGRGGW